MAAWAVVRGFGLDRGFPAAPLIAFTPYAAQVGLLAALITGMLGRRRPAVLIAISSAVLVVLVAPRAFPDDPPSPRPDGPELRVMTANLLLGEADLEDLTEQVREGDVDLISISELTPLASARLQTGELGELLPNHVIDPIRGSAGTGLFSRFPLEELPAPGVEGNDLPTVAARITLPGTSAEVYSIHPVPPTNGENVAGIRRYFEAVPDAPEAGEPRLLLGDFNATLDNDSLRDLLARGYVDAADAVGAGLVWTWRQSIHPPVAIDHVAVDERVEVLDLDAETLEGSDHRTLRAELRLPAGG